MAPGTMRDATTFLAILIHGNAHRRGKSLALEVFSETIPL
jgi:hypothetical protein